MLNDYYNREMELKNNPAPVCIQNQGTMPVMMYVPQENNISQEQMQAQAQYKYVNEPQINSNQVVEHQTNLSKSSYESYEEAYEEDDKDGDYDESILY